MRSKRESRGNLSNTADPQEARSYWTNTRCQEYKANFAVHQEQERYKYFLKPLFRPRYVYKSQILLKKESLYVPIPEILLFEFIAYLICRTL
jgi:hypothetical protein